jgi:hypothetical protein
MKERYNFSGSYFQDGQVGRVTGKFDLHPNGNFCGLMIDEESSVRQRKIHGAMKQEAGKFSIDFTVLVPGEEILNFRYHLEKTNSSSFEGRYAGSWMPIEKYLPSRENGGAIDLPSGDTCYMIGGTLKPRKEDQRQQDAEIILERVA